MDITSIGHKHVYGIPGQAGTANVASVREPVMGIGRHCKVESQELEGVSWMDELESCTIMYDRKPPILEFT